MQTQTISQRQLLTRHDADTSASVSFVPTSSHSSRQPVRVLLVVLALFAVFAISLGGWFLAQWAGLAAALGLVTVATVAGAGWLLAGVFRTLAELDRLVSSLGKVENLNVNHFRLTERWKEIAHRCIDSYSSLQQQLRERNAADHKLDIAQCLAQAGQHRAEAIVNSLTDAVLVTNSFGELQSANPEAERLFGLKLDTAQGMPVRQVLKVPALASLIEQVTQRGAGSQRHTEEISMDSGNKPYWYKVTIAAVVDSATEHLGIVTVLRDITSEKAALARSAEFVSAVSHEIKTPLASVKAYAEMLADGDADGDPETQQKFLNIIEVQTDRMTRLLESMLDIARIESGVVRVEKKIVSLNELIESGAKLMEPVAADKKISIETRLSSLYLGVVVDPDMMSRVVMNLISNAIKYTDSGGRIILRSQMFDDQATFEVEDTGRGIPAEAMPKLFQKFYRVKENSNVAPGTGLGLSLVKHIVEEVHGGKVDVTSEVGRGSIFRVKLPVERLN